MFRNLLSIAALGVAIAGPAEAKFTKCYPVSSREGWQDFAFPHGLLTGAWTEGGWSVDDARYARVGPYGHAGAAARALSPYDDYKYAKGLPFGALLLSDGRHARFVSWDRFFEAAKKTGPVRFTQQNTMAFRINDTGLGDNGGTLTVCFAFAD